MALRSKGIDKRFGVRSAQVPDGRTLWVVLEALEALGKVGLDTTTLRLSLTSGAGDGCEEILQQWSVPGPVTLSAAIDLSPLVMRDITPHRLDVHLVDGSHRRAIRVLGDVGTSPNDEFMIANVPHPDRAVRFVPLANDDGTLAIGVRAMNSTCWAARTSLGGDTFTIHGHCVPTDSEPPTHVTLTSDTAGPVDMTVQRESGQRWSASTSIAVLADCVHSGNATWLATVDGEQLRLRPSASPPNTRLRPRWTVEHAGLTGNLSASFRKSGVLTVDLTWEHATRSDPTLDDTAIFATHLDAVSDEPMSDERTLDVDGTL